MPQAAFMRRVWSSLNAQVWRSYALRLLPVLGVVLLWLIVYEVVLLLPRWRNGSFSAEYDTKTCTRDAGRVPVLAIDPPYTYYYPKSEIKPMYQPQQPFCGQDVRLFVAVKSAHANWLQRHTLRQTWASFNSCSDAAYVVSRQSCEQLWKKTRLLFFVGEMVDYDAQADLAVRFEAETRADMVQVSFLDSFRNITLKAVAMYDWISNYCSQVDFVLHTDDDTFVNLGNLWLLLGELNAGRMSRVAIYGHRMPGPSLIRDKASKWYVPTSLIPENTPIPDYIFGWHMLMSYETMVKLLNAAKCIPLLSIDDLFLSGLVASGIGIPISKSNCVDWKEINSIPSSTTGEDFASIIATHFGDTNMQRLAEAWKHLIEFGANSSDLDIGRVKAFMTPCLRP